MREMYLDYGYRSKCCYAPIRIGRKKVKNSSLRIKIWICCKCKARNVQLIKYTKGGILKSTEEFQESVPFIPEE